MRHFPPSLLAVLLMSILAAGFMLMWVSRTSNARAASARPMTDAVVQPPCGEAAFDTAFNTVNNGGGILTFNCGTATIFFSSQKVVTANVTIDGGGVMTLSGGNSTRLFSVAALQTLTLTNLTLTDGNSGAAPGGGVMITDTGSLVADNVVFDHNTSNDQDGSAIFGQGNAAITLTNTLVQNNTTNSFGALYSSGPVRISGSVFQGNLSALGGGALSIGGIVNVTATQFISNSTSYGHPSMGGAIYATNTAQITLTNVILRGNEAPTYVGGGIYNFGTATLINVEISNGRAGTDAGMTNAGTATLTDVMFSGNFAMSGGGITNGGLMTLTRVTINENSAAYYGGGMGNFGTAVLTDVAFSDNNADYGGGLMNWPEGKATLDNVTFSDNAAVHNTGGGIENRGMLTLTNVTLSGNWAIIDGGALANFGSANLMNVTISSKPSYANTSAILAYGTITMTNTVIANSLGPGNCKPINDLSLKFISKGYNLSDDSTCAAYLNQASDKNNVKARLSGLANFGGPTLTHMPLRGSPAINAGQCQAGIDQRGKPRPSGAACDIGAVERQPGDWDGYTYLPLAVRK